MNYETNRPDACGAKITMHAPGFFVAGAAQGILSDGLIPDDFCRQLLKAGLSPVIFAWLERQDDYGRALEIIAAGGPFLSHAEHSALHSSVLDRALRKAETKAAMRGRPVSWSHGEIGA